MTSNPVSTNLPKSFAQWCEERNFLPVTTQHTIDILLKEAGTDNYQEADVKLSNITYLHISDNQIIDLAPLGNLTNLTVLLLLSNQISDVSPLARLTNLTRLELSDNQIIDLAPLGNLTNLTYLGLADNQISDVKPLTYLTNLTELILFNNQISDIESLSDLTNCTNLTTLQLGFNQISDVKPLAHLNSLTTLRLCFNQISDVKPLAHLTNLKELYLMDNQISEIKSLTCLTNLTDLNLYGNQISAIESLASLTNLTYLGFAENQIRSIESLAHLTNLTDVNYVSWVLTTVIILRPGNFEWEGYINYIGLNHIQEIRSIDPWLNPSVDGSEQIYIYGELPSIEEIDRSLDRLPIPIKGEQYYQLVVDAQSVEIPQDCSRFRLLGYDLYDEWGISSLLRCGRWTGILAPIAQRSNKYGLLTLEDALTAQSFLPEAWNGDHHAFVTIYALFEVVR
jgi:internalin A